MLNIPAADPDHPESALNSIPKVVLQRARGKSLVPPSLYSTYPTMSLRSRCVLRHQSRLRVLRQGRLRACHCAPARWLLVGTILYRHRGCRLGSADRCRSHRVCHRAQQRGRRPCVLDGWQCHHRREHQRFGWPDRHRCCCAGERSTPRANVFVFKVQGYVLGLMLGD